MRIERAVWFSRFLKRANLLFALAGATVAVVHTRAIGAQAGTSAGTPRAAPTLGSMGLKPSGQVIQNAIVTWGFWGVNAYACTNNARFTECLIHVGNGSEQSGTLCLRSASLLYAATDSVAIWLKSAEDTKATSSDAQKSSSGIMCVTVPPHGRQSVIAQLGSVATRKPLGLALSLEERLPSGPVLTARTRVPLLAITP